MKSAEGDLLFSKSSAQRPWCFRGCAGECGHSLFCTPVPGARSGGGVPGSLDCPVARGSGDAEEFCDLRGGVFAQLVDLDQVLLLRRGQFGPLAAQSSSRFGNLHPLAGARTDQIGLEISDHREHSEEESAGRVGGIVNGTTDTELHFTTRVSRARQAAHASSGHSPPINSRSMTATLLSALSRRPAATSTPGPFLTPQHQNVRSQFSS